MNDQYEEGREVAGISVESGTVAVLNRSEIEQQVTTAHKFPRSIKRFRQSLLGEIFLRGLLVTEVILGRGLLPTLSYKNE